MLGQLLFPSTRSTILTSSSFWLGLMSYQHYVLFNPAKKDCKDCKDCKCPVLMTASLIVSKFIITDPRTLHFSNISVRPIRFDLYNRANHNLALAQKPKHDLHYRKEFISITLILSVSLPLARLWNIENIETTILYFFCK